MKGCVHWLKHGLVLSLLLLRSGRKSSKFGQKQHFSGKRKCIKWLKWRFWRINGLLKYGQIYYRQTTRMCFFRKSWINPVDWWSSLTYPECVGNIKIFLNSEQISAWIFLGSYKEKVYEKVFKHLRTFLERCWTIYLEYIFEITPYIIWF